MANEYQKFGTLEFRPSQRIDGHCDKFDMAGSDAHAFWSWREQGDDTGNVFEGLGFPVQDFTGAVVNFLKISVSGSRTDNDLCIEESLQPGHPIANTFVAFGKPTATIVITIDSLSAAALYLTTKHGTVAALHSGNLKAVCVHLRGRHPNSDFIVCVNGDGRDEHSRTLSEASEAARAIKAKVYASGSLTFFDQYLKDWGKSIEDVLCGVPAVSPWDHHRYDPALKMLGRPIAWPNRFNSAALLGNLMHWVKRYVCISDDLVLIVCLWIMHTFGIDKVRFSPLLAIMSIEYTGGTKTLIDVLRRVCCNAYKTSAITAGQVQRIVKEKHPTLLHDDGDTLFRSQPLIDVIRMSFDRDSGGATTTDSKGRLCAQSAFFAKATASMAGIPKSIEGLAIPVMVQRSDPSKKLDDLAPFDPKANDDFNALQAQIVRWWQDHAAEVAAWKSHDLDLGSAQANDTYQTILGIANAIGQDTLQRAVAAVKNILTQEVPQGIDLLLLDCIDDVTAHRTEKNIHSVDLATLMCKWMDHQQSAPFSDMNLDQTKLAALLAPHGIHPKQVRSNGVNKQGYQISDLRDAIAQRWNHKGRKNTAPGLSQVTAVSDSLDTDY